jgi:hypothetical protein
MNAGVVEEQLATCKILTRQGQEGMRFGAKERKEDGVLKGAGREEELSIYDVCGHLPCSFSEIHCVYCAYTLLFWWRCPKLR